MRVETRAIGSRGTEVLEVEPPFRAGPLRELLVALVRHQLTAYEEHRSASRALQVLTPADLARGVAAGAFGREPRTVPAPPSEPDAVARALEAFDDGLYFVFVDDTQLEDLDTTVELRQRSTVRLVRLVALAGG